METGDYQTTTEMLRVPNAWSHSLKMKPGQLERRKTNIFRILLQNVKIVESVKTRGAGMIWE